MRHVTRANLEDIYDIVIPFGSTIHRVVTFKLAIANSGKEFSGFTVRTLVIKRVLTVLSAFQFGIISGWRLVLYSPLRIICFLLLL